MWECNSWCKDCIAESIGRIAYECHDRILSVTLLDDGGAFTLLILMPTSDEWKITESAELAGGSKKTGKCCEWTAS